MVIFSSTRVYPDVSFDSESSKENQLDIRYLARVEKQFHRQNEYPETRNNDWILYAKSKLSPKLMQQNKIDTDGKKFSSTRVFPGVQFDC